MSDASQDVPEAPGFIASQLANAIDKMLEEWPTGQQAAKVTLHMTFDQWDELLGLLRSAEQPD